MCSSENINALPTQTVFLFREASGLEKITSSNQDFGWRLKLQVCMFIVPQCIKEEGYNKELALILYIRMSLFPWWLLWARSNMKWQQWSEYISITRLWHGLYLSSLTKSKHCGGAIKSLIYSIHCLLYFKYFLYLSNSCFRFHYMNCLRPMICTATRKCSIWKRLSGIYLKLT